MDAIARSLHIGSKNVSEFSAHLHIVDLYNVPLVEGECRIKWRFKGSIHLSNATTAVVMRDALEGTKGYHGISSKESTKGKEKEREKDDSEGELQERDHHHGRHQEVLAGTHGWNGGNGNGLASFKDAFRHPRHALRMARRSSATSQNREVTPDQNDDVFGSSATGANSSISTTAQDTNTSARSSRPLQSPVFIRNNGDHPFAPEGLSPTTTSGNGVPPTRISTRHSDATYQDKASPRSYYGKNNSVERDGGERENSPDMPAKTESKGTTTMVPLSSHACHFNQHIICAVSIPISGASGTLQPSPVRFNIRYKVRTSPQPCHPGDQFAHKVASSDNSHTNDASMPQSSRVAQPQAHAKDLHEEIHLGEVNLDLSEFVVSSLSMKATDRWTTRRYLLQNGKTNALLRIAVKMDWIGGERTFKASVALILSWLKLTLLAVLH